MCVSTIQVRQLHELAAYYAALPLPTWYKCALQTDNKLIANCCPKQTP